MAASSDPAIRLGQHLDIKRGVMANHTGTTVEQLQDIQVSLQEQLGRFKMWAGNAGAHQKRKMSLDYRLREAPHLYGQIVSLLEDLESALNEGNYFFL